MPIKYIVKKNTETLASVAKQKNVTVDHLLKFNPNLSKDSKLKVGDSITIDWIRYQLKQPKVIAIAKDTYLKPKTAFPDPLNLPGVPAPKYGQDISKSVGRAAPDKMSVGEKLDELKKKMRELLQIFASGDKSGMSARLFNRFLSKQTSVIYFDDNSLNSAASRHQNIIDFMSMALSAPNSPLKSAGKTRIHQALKKANWDINKIVAPTDLGVPAFNIGSKSFSSGDFNNGLGLMINGVQYVYVVATKYNYDEGKKKYSLTLKFIFYDVFGLDDEDLTEFGASSDGVFSSNAAIGITAWWQLQHQHGFAPLVTRIILEKQFEVPAT
jgi:hypothetical protein